MARRIHTGLIALFFAVGTGLETSPAQAASPLPKRPLHSAYSVKRRPIRSGYWFAPYLYYQTYGFGGIEGAPNDSPLYYGYGDSWYGSSGYALDASGFGN